MARECAELMMRRRKPARWRLFPSFAANHLGLLGWQGEDNYRALGMTHDHERAAVGATDMTTVSTEDPQFQSAIEACVLSLKRMADYELDPILSQRMHELAERKEYLDQDEQGELIALVDFSQKRTIEKLEATLALARLREALPSLLTD